LLRRFVEDQQFVIVDLILVLIGGMIGMYEPKAGLLCIPILLLPWGLRFTAGMFKFKSTKFNFLIFVFLFTAIICCFSAYDRTAAFQKLYFIILAVFLYYSLINQPEKNYEMVGWVFFIIGVGVSAYFLLTHDFVANPRDLAIVNQIGIKWMKVRPQLSWVPLPSGHVPGLSVLTATFGLYGYFNSRKKYHLLDGVQYIIGFLLIFTAVIATTSTSFWVALLGVVGVFGLWLAIKYARLNQSKHTFPWLVLLFLVVLVALVYLLGSAPSANPGKFGVNDRLEVFSRSIYLMRDFPFWGGGLASFPGLYSQYILNIPYYYFQDSYNLFLDVMIEQGVAGGLAILIIYLFGIYYSAVAAQSDSSGLYWLVLSILVFTLIHSTMQDYLFTANGVILLLFPPALFGMISQPDRINHSSVLFNNRARWIFSGLCIFLMIITGLHNRNKIESIWYANLGSIELSRIQLQGFPEAGWVGVNVSPKLDPAEASLLNALKLDPQNLTASYRLGLIYMIRQDFSKAADYLNRAYRLAPSHRGIIKSLGYSYLWLGDLDTAQLIFNQFPEVRDELDAYQSWWQNQGRNDLAKNASIMIGRLNFSNATP